MSVIAGMKVSQLFNKNSELFNGNGEKAPGTRELIITSVEYDSKKVGAGSCFVALKGTATDGHRFLTDAIERGAALLVVQEGADVENAVEGGVPIMRVTDTRKELARLADRFYGRPSKSLDVIGVTGTNGKTTVCYFLQSLLNCAGYRTSRFGTVEYDFPDSKQDADKTTPESADLQRMFKLAGGFQNPRCVMEVSSHGLAMGRLENTVFKGAVFTNISQDHLDFHKTMDEYIQAKKRFFTDYEFDYAAVNLDDPVGQEWLKGSVFNCRTITYGVSAKADVRLVKMTADIAGSIVNLATPDGEMTVGTKLAGEHNVYNAMAAVAVGIAEGFSDTVIQRGVASLETVPGRFEKVDEGQDFTVIVDYAHTDNALANALKAARKITGARVICMFGCGGDRDREKRSLMGAAVEKLADVLVVTSDNPRTEEPQAIIDEILKGVPKNSKKEIHVIPSRAEAIARAISMAGSGDLVLLAGKGHEDYQIIGKEKIHFDDREQASKALKGAF